MRHIFILFLVTEFNISASYFPDAEKITKILQKYKIFQNNPDGTLKVVEKLADQPIRDWTYESIINCMHAMMNQPALKRRPSLSDFQNAAISLANHEKQD